MLDPAGILSGSLLRNAKIHKKAGKQSVTLVNRLGDLMSLFRQCDKAIFIHQNISVLSKILHGDADAWLGKRKCGCNVDRADISLCFSEHQDGFQIVFSGFLYFHQNVSFHI